MVTDKVGDTIPIGDGSLYRLYCYDVWKYSSQWTIQVYQDHKVLWWEWSGWEVLKFITNYGAGKTTHEIEIKRKGETDQELIWIAESELEFLGLDYE
jgi:hypothetical protein